MKQALIQTALILLGFCARGQGTLEFDQSVNPTTAPGVFENIQPDPTGESFVPTLSSVGFVQFYLGDPIQVQGPTLYVDLWSGSLTNGTLLGQSSPVSLSRTFFGTTTFFFQNPVVVTPGTTYYLEPVIQSGDSEEIGIGAELYPNGIAYLSGTPEPQDDLWFREGIVVPEPSFFSLVILGLAGIYSVSRNRRNLNPKAHRKGLCSEKQPLSYSSVSLRPD